jgi:S1-C subfamily serine protease
MPSDSSTKVIAYCGTGRRSSAVAGALSRLLGVEVRSLCGGILAYYNEGGSVRSPSGAVVQAVHPGGAAYKDLITRPNAFKLHE